MLESLIADDQYNDSASRRALKLLLLQCGQIRPLKMPARKISAENLISSFLLC